ncbi:hypothetical protein [Thauera sp. 27]|uniref:hypothetical protein n=1 Tax=Thauera sp. 27 TaxID=305700 RepID=UPI001E56BC61|nr:hypothetical protein [Thauera sp. 27]
MNVPAPAFSVRTTHGVATAENWCPGKDAVVSPPKTAEVADKPAVTVVLNAQSPMTPGQAGRHGRRTAGAEPQGHWFLTIHRT